MHPTAQERVQSLQDATRLFRATWVIPFFSGFLVAYSLYGLAAVIINSTYAGTVFRDMVAVAPIVASTVDPGLSPITTLGIAIFRLANSTFRSLTTLVYLVGIAVLITGTLGVQAQRQTLSDLAHRHGNLFSYARLWIPAGLFALGMALAVGLMFGPLMVAFLAAAPVIAGLVWLFLCYVRFFSVRVFRTHQGLQVPARGAWFVRTAAGITLMLILFSALGGPAVALASFLVQTMQRVNTFWEENPEVLMSVQETMREDPTISMLDLAAQHPEFQEAIQTILSEYQFPIFWAAVGSLFFIGMSYSFMFGLTWMLVTVWRAMTGSQCRACRKVRIASVFHSPRCPTCGAEWAGWAYVEGT